MNTIWGGWMNEIQKNAKISLKKLNLQPPYNLVAAITMGPRSNLMEKRGENIKIRNEKRACRFICEYAWMYMHEKNAKKLRSTYSVGQKIKLVIGMSR